MKSLLSGFACTCLVWFCCAAPAGAQQPGAPPAAGAPGTPDSQTPASPDQPSEEPEAGTRPLQIPELPRIPDVRMPGEQGIWLGTSAWLADSRPSLRKGSSVNEYPGNLDLAGKPNFDEGIEGGVALGSHNVLRFDYIQSRAAGSVIAPWAIGAYTVLYQQGNYVATDYRLQSFKVSFDYLTWPYPVKTSRFRLKTLWQFQYMQIRNNFDAPYNPTVDASGNPLLDANGNPVTYATQETKHFYLPEVGLGVQEWVRPGFRLEASASGFSIPHHQNSWDVEASANVRVGRYELGMGVRQYHFRTSAQQDFWLRGTMFGPFLALRVYSNQMH